MQKIVYIISHGHTARGALQTGLLGQLSKVADVHVVAKPDAVEALSATVEKEGASIHAFESKIDRGDEHRGILRSHVHQNIRKNPALWEKHLWRTRSNKNSLKRRLPNHLYYYLGAFIRVLPGGRKAFTKMEANGYFKPDAARILEEIRPDVIISTRPVDEMEICLLEAARRLGIHRSIYILSWDNITSKGVFPVLGDSYLTWGPVMNEELKEYYNVPGSEIFNTGVTHFDIHARVREGELKVPALVEQLGLDNQKPYLFFTMSASYFAPNEIDIVEWLAREVENNTFGEEMQLIVRPHMANLMASRSDQSWLGRLEKLPSKRVALDLPGAENSLLTWYMKHNDMIKLSSLINGASVCLNSGSTIAIEAAYLNRPVVLTAFDLEDFPKWKSARRLLEYIHLTKFVSFGGCSVTTNLQTLKEAIENYLQNPQLHEAERQKAVEMECYKNDGHATQRFVENITTILKRVENQ